MTDLPPLASRHGARAALACLALTALLAPIGAAAQEESEADRTLRGFTRVELRQLQPLLASGSVCLVEFSPPDRLPEITVATEVRAPASEVAAVIGDPAHYPDFMPALDSVSVTADEGLATSYSWAWQAAVFTLGGTNVLQRFPPPEGHPERGWRFEVRATGGDLGTGRTVFRVLPQGEHRTILVSSSRMDLRDATYLTRQLAGAGASTNRTINMAIAIAMVMRTRMEAERRAGLTRSGFPPTSAVPARPGVDWVALEPILLRGDLIWFESSGTDLGRVAVTGVVPASEERVRTAMLDPQGFAQGLLRGAHATVIETTPEGTRFEWGIDLPLVGTSGEMRIGSGDDGLVHMDGVRGALSSARWRFDTMPRPYGTLVTTWGTFDLAEGLWLMRVLVDADGAFRPGLSSAAQLMMVRGLRVRIERGI